MPQKTVRLRDGGSATVFELAEPVAVLFELCGVMRGTKEGFPMNYHLWTKDGFWRDTKEPHPMDIINLEE